MCLRTMIAHVFVTLAFLVPHVIHADTAFTYQGRLTESGAAVNDVCDLRFRLYDAPSAGNQIGSHVNAANQHVIDGLFAVELDFGASAFDNSERWLAIDVRCSAGQGAYTTLNPRQKIARSPYAIQTRGIIVDSDENVGIGTSFPAFRLHVDGGTDVGPSGGGYIVSGDAASLNVAIDNNEIMARDDGGNSPLYLNHEGGDVLISASGGGGVGIGTTALGSARLRVIGEEDGTAISATGAGFDSVGVFGFGYRYGVHGFGPASVGVRGESTAGLGTGVFGYASSTGGTNWGVYGKSDSVDGFDVYAGGVGRDYGSSSSIRWKHNVEAIDDPLYKLSKLRGVYFDWDEEHGGHHDIGMIAEEVGAVLPEIVNHEENGVDAIGMDYSRLTPLLIEAVKAVHRENRTLHAHNLELSDRIAELKAMVAELLVVMKGNNE